MTNKEQNLVEVCRSFSYKLNCGNYESRDFFCSQKAEVLWSEAGKASEALYKFCKSEVVKSVNSYKLENLKNILPKKKLTYKEREKGKEAQVDILKEEHKDEPF